MRDKTMMNGDRDGWSGLVRGYAGAIQRGNSLQVESGVIQCVSSRPHHSKKQDLYS